MKIDELKKAEILLKEIFGYDEFRPMQRNCIEKVLQKKDSILIMPTGGGKSLCYQIPAMIFPGLTIVVSPLISLMKDQVDQLLSWGVNAAMLNSTLTWDEYDQAKNDIMSGQTKILFVAPETLMKEDVLQMLSCMRVDCVTIDEAHCISDWGHDFRPEYRLLKDIRSNFSEVVYLAMTATATPRVQEDIIRNLNLQSPCEFKASFNRDNLFYEVLEKNNPLNQALDFIKRFQYQSGIVYCFSRKQVESLTKDLNLAGCNALSYHAGLSAKVRTRNQQRFIRDDVQIMVATIAFGMGINKPNVRFVVHYDLPKNIESYYQETGRAGRDGLPSHCLLLFGYGDIHKIKFFIDQKDFDERKKSIQYLNSMVNFAETTQCRRIPLISYFGEVYDKQKCGLCDNCVKPKEKAVDISIFAKKCLAVIMRTGQRFGTKHVIDVLRGSCSQKVLNYEHHELDVHGIGKDHTAKEWQHLIRQFLQKDILLKEEEYGVLKFKDCSYEVLQGGAQVLGLLPPKDKTPTNASKSNCSSDFKGNKGGALFNQLRLRRKEIADRKGVPPYIIFSDKSLMAMSTEQPKTTAEFANIFGVGEKKLRTYGPEFLNVIRSYQKEGVA